MTITLDEDLRDELRLLVLQLSEATLTQPDAERLFDLLRTSTAARQFYLQEIHLTGSLYWDNAEPLRSNLNRQLANRFGAPPAAALQGDWCPAAIPNSSSTPLSSPTAQAVGQDTELPTANTSQSWALGFLTSACRLPSSVLASPKALAAVVAGGLLTYFFGLALSVVIGRISNSDHPEHGGKLSVVARHDTVVGSVVQSETAKWSEESAAADDSLVRVGAKFSLAQGQVRMRLARGVAVMIAGPAVWSIDENQRLNLNSGKLLAHVPKAAIGFTVITPTAEIVDLGTDFSVVVDEQEQSQLQVTRGEVQVVGRADRPTTGPQPRHTPWRVTAGQAVLVVRGGSVQRVAFQNEYQQAAVEGESLRRLWRELDLVDLLSGGDGTGQQRGIAIDPSSGRFGRLDTVHAFHGDNTFHRTLGHSIVDGVFLPNGETQIDSTGGRFTFSETSGQTCNYFWTGGTVDWLDPGSPAHAVLSGIDYSSESHGQLMMVPNKGLTIDLKSVRRLMPGGQITGFQAIAGNCFVGSRLTTADLYVLVDGRCRFHRGGFSPADGGFRVAVPLTAKDRFLTLAATEGPDGIADDYVLLGDPSLEIMATPDTLEP